MTEIDFIKEPFSFPRLTSEINPKDAASFVDVRYLGLFWCEDLCCLPEEEGEGMGIWVRYPRNARQAVALDLTTARGIKELVGRSTLTLHNLCSWYQRNPEKCKRDLEPAVPGASLGRVLILLDLLTIDPEIKKRLRNEFKNREVKKRTLKYGHSVEDEERESREEVDVFNGTGHGQLRGSARSGSHDDDNVLLGAAAASLHETWRAEVPKRPFWKQISEIEYKDWFDERFHKQLVRSPLGQRLINVNAPHMLLPPSLQAEGKAVALSCLNCLRANHNENIDLLAAEIHKHWLSRRRREWEDKSDFEVSSQQSPISTSSVYIDISGTDSVQQDVDVPKWSPLGGPVLSQVVLESLRSRADENDKCVALLCLDAFQAVADRAINMPEMAVKPVTLSVHKQAPAAVGTLDELRKRVAAATTVGQKKKTKDGPMKPAAEIITALGSLTAASIISPDSRVAYDVFKTDDNHDSKPYIYHVNLNHVDLVTATTPAPSTTHFISSLSNHQATLFEEMRPLAKRVLSNMDKEMKAHIKKGKDALRYRIDEASLLIGAPSLEKSVKMPTTTLHTLPSSQQSIKKHNSKELAAILNPSNPNLISTLQILSQTKDTLRELLLRNCGIGAGAMSRLRKDGLVKCNALTTIDLSENPLGSEGAAVLARSLSSLPLLKCLGVRSTGCSGEGAHLLFRALKYHRVMTVDISDNSLGTPEAEGIHGPVMRALKALLRNNVNLTHLDLSWNGFRKDMCMKIGEWIKGNHCLFGLHITGNKGCNVDARGFIRKRNNIPSAKVTPAYVTDYPNNPIQPPIERCWICGRWSEKQIVFELDCSVLPIAPQRKSGDSVSGGGTKSKRGGAKGGNKRRGSQSSAMSASSAGTSDRAGAGDYDHIVVTLHLSIDDPPFSASVMDQQDMEEELALPKSTAEVTPIEIGTVDGLLLETKSKAIKKYFVMHRMLPPGQLQYYFMVFGDGKPLLRFNGSDLEPTAPHKAYFLDPSRQHEAANFQGLIRPDVYGKDTEESTKVHTIHPKCGFMKVPVVEEFIDLVQEERVNDFQCVNLDEEEEEEEEVEEVVEEVDWHPRDSIFVSRRDATGGSFFDALFDHGPQEKEMTAAELADSIDGKTGGMVTSKAPSSKEINEDINEEEGGERNTKPPLTLAFEADAKHLKDIMESGTKKARAFFPNEITDLFIAAEGKEPKPSHRSHDDQRKAMMLAMLTAAVNAEAEARTTRLEKLGFESVGPTTSYDSGSSEASDPVTELFATMQNRYSTLQGIYRYYSSLNSRNPFSMSVHSWLALCKDTGIDKLVAFEVQTGPNGSVKKLSAEHEESNSKMALEVIFFTATASGDDQPEHASAIDLNYSKHDMRRHEFILALMALARYRQRRMVRQVKEKKDKYLTSLFVKDSREQWGAMSFNEFLDILDLDIIGKLEKGHAFNGDTFREAILYSEPVATVYANFETTLRFNYNSYKLSPMGCGRKHTQLPLSAFIRMMKDCGVLGDLVSSQDISQAFMESRMVRDCEVVAGDRCLSLVDLMEALLRLAYKIQNIWPSIDTLDKHSIDTSQQDFESLDSLAEFDDFGSFKEVSISKEDSKTTKKEEAAQKEKNVEELDPLLQAAQRSLRNILELLLMALKDRDIPGLRYLFQERKRKETERLARLQRLVPPPGAGGGGGINVSSGDAPMSPPTESVDESESIHSQLLSLEKVTTQAIHIQRVSKSHNDGTPRGNGNGPMRGSIAGGEDVTGDVGPK